MTEHNLIAQFKDKITITSVCFMEIWTHYDRDGSGTIEMNEFERFIKDLLAAGDSPSGEADVKDYIEAMAATFGVNHPAQIELDELARMLPIEDNFLAKFNGREPLSREEIETIFSYYDKDRSGAVQGAELHAFIHDILRKGGKEPTKTEVDCYVTMVLALFDNNVDGELHVEEFEKLLGTKV